jgi:hypothetical protein
VTFGDRRDRVHEGLDREALEDDARAPDRTAASASSARSLAVTTTTATRSASALMSMSELRSICRSRRRMSNGLRSTSPASRPRDRPR